MARDYPGAEVLNWKDLSPRVAASYDLFGNGKTAVKFSLARYVLQEGKGNTNSVHPVIAATNSVSRTWTDRNGDFIVQGDPLNPLLNDELGPSPNNNFGKPNTTLRFDPDWATGFGARPFNWEMLVTLQHELAPRVGLEVTYNRRSYGNFIVNDNTLVAPADYDAYCINAPVDARLPERRRPADLRAVRSEQLEGGAGGHAQNEFVGLRRSVRALERPRRVGAGAAPERHHAPGRLQRRHSRWPTTATSSARSTTPAPTCATASRRSCRR